MKNLIYLAILLLLYGCNLTQDEKTGTEGDSKNQYANIPFLDTIFRADDPNEFRPWQLRSFVNESGNETDEKYIKYYTTTYFSNPDSSYQYVYVEIIVTKNVAGIFLHDSGSNHPAKRILGTVTMTMAISNDEKSAIEIDTEWDINGGFRIVNKTDSEKLYFTAFLNYLKNSSPGFRVTFENESLTDYSFYVATKGFSEEFAML